MRLRTRAVLRLLRLPTLLSLCLASATAALADEVARDIVRRAVVAEGHNWKLARNYGFSERVDSRRFDSQGRLKSRDVKTNDVMLLEGSPYRRLAGRNDLPLTPVDEKKEKEKFLRSTADRRNETPAQRAIRVTEYERRPEWQREAWHELPEAFDFRLIAEEEPDGNGSYVIEATPRQDYRPRSRTGKVLLHLRGKLWVDKQDFKLVKAEVEVIDTIWVGLFLVRLSSGSRAAFEQIRVNEDVWLPQRVQVFLSAHLGLLKVLHMEQEVVYSKCREFQTGSPVTSHWKAR